MAQQQQQQPRQQLPKERMGMRGQIEQLEKQLETMQTQNVTLDSYVSQLNKVREYLEKENKRLKEEVASLKAHAQMQADHLSSYARDLADERNLRQQGELRMVLAGLNLDDTWDVEEARRLQHIQVQQRAQNRAGAGPRGAISYGEITSTIDDRDLQFMNEELELEDGELADELLGAAGGDGNQNAI